MTTSLAVLARSTPVIAGILLAGLGGVGTALGQHVLWQHVNPMPELGGFANRVEPAGDVNGDGIPDLLVREEPAFSEWPLLAQVHLFLGSCDGSFSGPVATISGPPGSDEDEYFASEFGGADLTGDGFSDVVILQSWHVEGDCLDHQYS